jgi:hypothetical protein
MLSGQELADRVIVIIPFERYFACLILRVMGFFDTAPFSIDKKSLTMLGS